MWIFSAALHKLNFVHNYSCTAKRNLPYYIFCPEIALLDSIIFCVGYLRKITHLVQPYGEKLISRGRKILLRRTKYLMYHLKKFANWWFRKFFFNYPQSLWITLWISTPWQAVRLEFMRVSINCWKDLQKNIRLKSMTWKMLRNRKNIIRERFLLLFPVSFLCIRCRSAFLLPAGNFILFRQD